MILDGRQIAENLYEDLRERVTKLKKKKITPHLVVFLVGENPASVAYVNQKQKKGEEIGAIVTVEKLKTSITTEELEEKIKLLNDDPYVHAIMIQRPLPEHIDINKLELLTNPQKDIDGFHPDSPYTLPVPLAVVKILEHTYKSLREAKKTKQSSFEIWLNSQNIVLLGKGPTGGGPVIEYFKKIKIKLHLIDSKTKNAEQIMQKADIIISAVGRENTIKPNIIKKGVILLSVGLKRGQDNKLHGDYDEEKIKNIASYYTPTPGGVGPVNVAMLMENLLTATEKQTSK